MDYYYYSYLEVNLKFEGSHEEIKICLGLLLIPLGLTGLLEIKA